MAAKLKESQKAARLELAQNTLGILLRGVALPKHTPTTTPVGSMSKAMEKEWEDLTWQRRFMARLLEHGLAEMCEFDDKEGMGFRARDFYVLKAIHDEHEEGDGLFLASLLFPDETGGVQLPERKDAIDHTLKAADKKLDELYDANTPDSPGDGGVVDKFIHFVGDELKALAKTVSSSVKALNHISDTNIDLKKTILELLEAFRDKQAEFAEFTAHIEQKIGGNNRRIDELDKRQAELTKQVQAALAQVGKGEVPEEVVQVIDKNAISMKAFAAGVNNLAGLINRERRDRLVELAERLKQNTEDAAMLHTRILEVTDGGEAHSD
jgi:predicted nucleic-acid-binding protein